MRPLSGIDIVEVLCADCPLALRLAAAMAGRIAADLGAQVRKIEPPEGDPVRRIPPLVGDTGALFAFLNAGKISLAAGARDAKTTLKTSHVVITDDTFARSSPRGDLPKIAAIFSLFAAAGGPSIASEFTISALSGVLDLVGEPNRQPLKLAGHQTSYAAGLAGYAGIAAALCNRDAVSTVRIGLYDVSVWLNWKTAVLAAIGAELPVREGKNSLWQVVRCADGWVALVFEEQDWQAMRELVADPRIDDPRFATPALRREHMRDLVAVIEESLMRRTRADIRAIALAKRLPIGPIWSPSEIEHDPQSTGRHLFARLPLNEHFVVMPRLPVLWTGEAFTPGAVPELDAAELVGIAP